MTKTFGLLLNTKKEFSLELRSITELKASLKIKVYKDKECKKKNDPEKILELWYFDSTCFAFRFTLKRLTSTCSITDICWGAMEGYKPYIVENLGLDYDYNHMAFKFKNFEEFDNAIDSYLKKLFS